MVGEGGLDEYQAFLTQTQSVKRGSEFEAMAEERLVLDKTKTSKGSGNRRTFEAYR